MKRKDNTMTIEELGHLVATKAVAELQESNLEFNIFTGECIRRYLNGDWGDLPASDSKMNDDAVKSGEDRILAAYEFPPNAKWNAINSFGMSEDKIWIITERDHSVTTILFPGEY
jgi:hypothetical protein